MSRPEAETNEMSLSLVPLSSCTEPDDVVVPSDRGPPLARPPEASWSGVEKLIAIFGAGVMSIASGLAPKWEDDPPDRQLSPGVHRREAADPE